MPVISWCFILISFCVTFPYFFHRLRFNIATLTFFSVWSLVAARESVLYIMTHYRSLQETDNKRWADFSQIYSSTLLWTYHFFKRRTLCVWWSSGDVYLLEWKKTNILIVVTSKWAECISFQIHANRYQKHVRSRPQCLAIQSYCRQRWYKSFRRAYGKICGFWARRGRIDNPAFQAETENAFHIHNTFQFYSNDGQRTNVHERRAVSAREQTQNIERHLWLQDDAVGFHWQLFPLPQSILVSADWTNSSSMKMGQGLTIH